MENREVINWLTRIRDRLMTTNSKQYEALAIAISALEKQSVDKCCETCKNRSRSAQEIPCCDCYMASCFEDCYEPCTEEEA